MQPAPDGGLADGGSDAAGAGGTGKIVEAPARQGQAVLGGGFASQGANLHNDLRGESPRATGAREFLKAIQAVFEEALAPEADDLAARVEALGDEAIGEVLGGEKHHLGADNLEIRQRIAGGPALQFAVFVLGQDDGIGALARHGGSVKGQSAMNGRKRQTINTLVYLRT